jgi:hypothetical protein
MFPLVRVRSQGTFQDAVDFREIERFFEELQRPAGERPFPVRLAGVAAHDDDLRIPRYRIDLAEQVDPVRVGEVDVEEDDVVR